jgi:hypothetical protein
MGLLAAVRQWYQRDHAAEQAMWRGWLRQIEARLNPQASIRFEYLEPEDLSNKAPRLRIHWDAKVLGITGTELVAKLDAGTPRIMVESGTGGRPSQMESALTIMPYMMDPGEERILADALYSGLRNPDPYSDPVLLADTAVPVAGDWAVTVQYGRGTGEQHFSLKQSGNRLVGLHKGEIYTGPIAGTAHADTIELHSHMAVPGNAIYWTFTGTVRGGRMSGMVDMGEYGPASFMAVRT